LDHLADAKVIFNSLMPFQRFCNIVRKAFIGTPANQMTSLMRQGMKQLVLSRVENVIWVEKSRIAGFIHERKGSCRSEIQGFDLLIPPRLGQDSDRPT
jgi:hypothetical protein